MANQTSAIYTDDTAKTIDTSLNAKLKDITGQSILASIGAYFTAAKNAIESRLKSQNIADVEATATASKPYVQGEHLMYNGDLYKAKTAIAQGATLTVGTNIEAAKVGTEISQLNSALAHVAIIPTDLHSSITITRNSSYRIGKLVYISLLLKATYAISSEINACYVPTPLTQTSGLNVGNATGVLTSENPDIKTYITYGGAIAITPPSGGIAANTAVLVSGCYLTRAV